MPAAASGNSITAAPFDDVPQKEYIDALRAQRAADEAREQLLQKKSREEYKLAQATLARALNRLRAKDHQHRFGR